MRTILRTSRTPTCLFMTIVVFIALFTLTTLEFGSASVRSIICRATYSQTPFGTTHVDNFAQSINASTLIASMLAMQDGRKASVSIALGRILHQSWKTQDPPPAYHSLIASWRSIYPDWTYVLWDNEDNLALVDTFYPEWRSAYDALPSDIYRAGFARNLYMHTFGGIYADIDSEAITPLHPLLDAQKKSPPIAFLGAMDTSSHELHSIPNAFMAASAAGHPLWLVAAEDAVDWARARSWDHSVPAPGPEYVTGSVSLRRAVMNYSPSFLKPSPTTTSLPPVFNTTVAPVVVFSPEVIYPFAWDRPRPHVMTAAQECVCWMAMPTFNPGACKRMTGAQWVIHYWKHSWQP